MAFDWSAFGHALVSRGFLEGAWLTVSLTVVSLATAMVLGLGLALMGTSRLRAVRALAWVYFLVLVSLLMLVQAWVERRFRWTSAVPAKRRGFSAALGLGGAR